MAQPVSTEIERKVNDWLTGPFDEKTKEEVRALKKDHPQELIDAFFTDLSFGTGGLRGIMGPGTNRMNIYTVQLATQGLANYLKQTDKTTITVLIGFDSRHHSEEFAKQAARVLAGNKIHVYLLDALRPTPYISFACRHMKASAAIMITASHNPKEYNGYKVYWEDGAQVVFPHDVGIVQEAEKLKGFSDVKLAKENDERIEIVSTDSLDEIYLKAIHPLQHFASDNQNFGSSLKIIYTSLHGTGITIVPKALKSWGFTCVRLVDEQVTIDGDFPTVKFPNPEYPETLKLGIDYLKKIEGDIVLATDPDADRIGVVVEHKGEPVRINGNEMAAICAEYLCEVSPFPQAVIVTTIVTTELLKKIAQAHHVKLLEVLTGFKYIGEQIHLWETEKNGNQFLFGAEESYGYLIGTHARDKDAIVLSCLIAEIALHAKLKGKTLIDRLHAIYQKYGIFREKQQSINFNPGKEGMEQMAGIMANLRAHPPQTIGNSAVTMVEDYQTQKRLNLESSVTEKLTLPVSDVLLFRLADGSRVIIRPSGTEPKIKIYASVSLERFDSIEEGIQECDTRLEALLNAFQSGYLMRK